MKGLMMILNPFNHDLLMYNESKSSVDAEHKVTVLAWTNKDGERSKIIESVIEVNDLQPLKLVKLLKKHISNLKEKQLEFLDLRLK